MAVHLSISSLPLSCLLDYLFCTVKAGCTPTPTDCTCIKDVFCIMSFKMLPVVWKRLRWLWHLTARPGGVEVGRAMAELMCTGVLIMLHWRVSFILPPACTHTLLTSPLTINACDDRISKCHWQSVHLFICELELVTLNVWLSQRQVMFGRFTDFLLICLCLILAAFYRFSAL